MLALLGAFVVRDKLMKLKAPVLIHLMSLTLLATFCLAISPRFDVAFTSVLQRAIKTLFHIQESLDAHWIPVNRHWRLNERMYGALQGLNKAETAAKHGEKQVRLPPLPIFSSVSPFLPSGEILVGYNYLHIVTSVSMCQLSM